MDRIDRLYNLKKGQDKEDARRKRERHREIIVLGKDGYLCAIGDPDFLNVTNQTTGVSYKAKVKDGVVIPCYLGLPVRFHKSKDCDYGWIAGVDVDSVYMTQDMKVVLHEQDNTKNHILLEYFESTKG